MPGPLPSSSSLSIVLPGLAVAAARGVAGTEKERRPPGVGSGISGDIPSPPSSLGDAGPRRRPRSIGSTQIKNGSNPNSDAASKRRSPTTRRRWSHNADDRDDAERRWRERAADNVSRLYARRMLTLAEERSRAAGTRDEAREALGGSPSSVPRSEELEELQRAFGSRRGRKLDGVTRGRVGAGKGRNEERILAECWRRTMTMTAGPMAMPMFTTVAQCESAAARTKAMYQDEGDLKHQEKEKPAEWESHHDIDLTERRARFGKDISPLENTTRLERWSAAVGRIVALGSLAAPLAAALPLTLVLGRFAGSGGGGAATGSKGGGDEEEGAPSDAAAKVPFLRRQHERLVEFNWDYALWAIEQAGPTCIKLVQWASTRNDLFSPDFVGHFSKLQDETRGHQWKDTEAALVRTYGKDWRSVLAFEAPKDMDDDDDEMMTGVNGGRVVDADRERQKRLQGRETMMGSASSSPALAPIGSGCVAQVYKARLRRSHGLHPAGTTVAVKVQHPKILEKVCVDFYIMNKVASMLEFIPYLNLDYLSMKDSVDQFRDIMLPQLDLRVEAHNLQRFRRDFEGEDQITFPEPLMSLTSKEVLVERFVEGEPMLNFVLMNDEHHTQKDKKELATIGLKTVMKMIFLHDFIHADLHPGNMIVDRNKSVRGHPIRINMIDCGLTVELGENDHMNLVKILGSLIKRDGYAAGQLMVDTAKKCQATELDVELFAKGIERICIDDEENNFLEKVGDYLTDICFLACRHTVKLEASFINAALACEIMEGLASSLHPDMQVQKVALPMVIQAEMMHGLKGLPTPRLWS